jgi:hypothetical protein
MSGTIEDLDDPLPRENLFYLQDIRQVAGNCAILWRENGHGYTCNLAHAGKYHRTEAESIVRGSEGHHVMLPCAEVDAIAVTHVRAELLRELRVQPTEKP